MSGGSVSVLVPNGRRQTVKCTPNTTILQILEDVCKKQDLKSEEFDLKHHNKILDTTIIFRFSGLPNNAQLELVPATKARAETEVTLAINLENGSRLIGKFNPNDTLLNILNKLCPESLKHDKHPVVIYTRREIYGKELENVTLRSLGLTGGRAMIRLLDRSPEELKKQANVSAPLPSKPVEEKPYVRKIQREPSPPKFQQQADDSTYRKAQEKNEGENSKSQKHEKNSPDILKLAREKRKSNDSSRSQNDEKRKSTDRQIIIGNKDKRNTCQCKRGQPMEIDCLGECQERCTNKQDNIEDEFIFLGERNAMLFSLETAEAVPSEELPDDFFELTIDDARKILRDVKRQRYTLENSPFMTNEYRNLEESKKQLMQLHKYKKAIIRVQFPDRTVLQGTFSPIDMISDVVNFVREYLADKKQDFYLYSTPPKCILAEDKRLMELGFVPGAMVYFGTNSKSKNSSFLRQDLQDQFTSNSLASLAATKMRRQNRRCSGPEVEEDDFDMEDSSSIDTNAGASTSTGITHENYSGRRIVRSTEKLPKWFKP